MVSGEIAKGEAKVGRLVRLVGVVYVGRGEKEDVAVLVVWRRGGVSLWRI